MNYAEKKEDLESIIGSHAVQTIVLLDKVLLKNWYIQLGGKAEATSTKLSNESAN